MLVFNLCKQNQDHFTYTFLQAFTLFYKFIICTRYSAARRLPLYNHARKVWLLYINFTYFSIVLPPSFCTEYLLPLKFVFHVKTSSIEGLCPLKVLLQGLLSLRVFFYWKFSSPESFISLKFFFHGRSSSFEGLLLLKIFFLCRSFSIQGLLPEVDLHHHSLNIIFHWRQSFRTGLLPWKNDFHWCLFFINPFSIWRLFSTEFNPQSKWCSYSTGSHFHPYIPLGRPSKLISLHHLGMFPKILDHACPTPTFIGIFLNLFEWFQLF